MSGFLLREACSKQFYALVFTMLTGMLLVGAIAAPWFVIEQKVNNPAQFRSNSMFWWRGMYVTTSAVGQSDQEFTVDWEESETFQTRRPEVTYILSASFAVTAFVVTLLLFFGILFILVIPATRVRFENATSRSIGGAGLKWLSFGISLLVMILTILSWGLFLEFPEALKEAKFCNKQEIDQSLWCSSFIGEKDVVDGEWTLSASWFPFIGWIFTVVATGTSAVSTILLGLVKRSPHGGYLEVN